MRYGKNITTVGGGSDCVHFYGDRTIKCFRHMIKKTFIYINYRDMNGNTILHLVAANGAAHLVDTLLRIEGYQLIILCATSYF